MKTLIIYDSQGYIISNITGSYRVPAGVPFLEVEIPEDKRIATVNGLGVDVSVTPHKVILEDIPKSEIEALKEDATAVAEMAATVVEDNASIADTLAIVLLELENMKAEITALKGVS